MQKIIIAIDGYSACGKSTLARQLAKKLSYTHIDSGAMYRAITFYFLQNTVNITHEEELKAALKQVTLQFIPSSTGRQELWMNGKNVEQPIRGTAVADNVSKVAMLREVRAFAVKCQRAMGADNGIVMDGRDIGTVVFPDAALKLFMTASFEVRIQRRWEELKYKQPGISYEEVKANLADRDYKDTHRTISPLRQAPDAIVLDNTYLTEEEQLDYAFDLAKKTINNTTRVT